MTYTDHISIISNPLLFLFSPHPSHYISELTTPFFKQKIDRKKTEKKRIIYRKSPVFKALRLSVSSSFPSLPHSLFRRKREEYRLIGTELLWEI